MKKSILVLLMFLALTVPAFSCADPPCDVDATASSSLINIGPQSGTINQPTNNVLSPTATGGSASTGAITNTNNVSGGQGFGGSAVANGGAGGAGGNAVIEKGAIDNKNTNTNMNTNTNVNTNANTNLNTNTNLNSNIQGQQQGQGQSQSTKNSNNAKQTVLFESPTPLLNPPSQIIPQLNFGNGRMVDATKSLPNFAIYGITPLGAEPIREVLSVNANVKFKRLYQAILDGAKAVASGGKKTLTDVRYQVIRAEGQKSWSTGGNLGGAGSVLSTSGLSGASAAGSIIPQFGGTKSDDLFTIIFLKIAQ